MAKVFFFIENHGKDSSIGVKLEKVTIPWKDIIATRWTMLRASAIGFVAGILPGAGASLGSFLAYMSEKSLAGDKAGFGSGVPRGVAAPEAGNNAVAGGALVPMLTPGVPTVPVIPGILLGGNMEDALRRTMVISGGDPVYLFSSAIAGFVTPMFLRGLLRKPQRITD